MDGGGGDRPAPDREIRGPNLTLGFYAVHPQIT